MRNVLLTATFSGLAAPALAHPGHHEAMPSEFALHHLLQSPDHLLMVGAFAVIILAGGAAWLRRRNAR